MGILGNSIAAVAAATLVGAQFVYDAVCAPGFLLRPPGIQSEEDFCARCVGCGKCLEACPYQAIHMTPRASGLSSGTPVIDAREQACRLCVDFPCVKACPTGALRNVTLRSDVLMGTAVIDEKLCIAIDKGIRCEVCYRTCPLINEAIDIEFRPREGDGIHMVFAPVIDAQRCVGCGLCVQRCVIGDPRVAIRIESSKRKTEGHV